MPWNRNRFRQAHAHVIKSNKRFYISWTNENGVKTYSSRSQSFKSGHFDFDKQPLAFYSLVNTYIKRYIFYYLFCLPWRVIIIIRICFRYDVFGYITLVIFIKSCMHPSFTRLACRHTIDRPAGQKFVGFHREVYVCRFGEKKIVWKFQLDLWQTQQSLSILSFVAEKQIWRISRETAWCHHELALTQILFLLIRLFTIHNINSLHLNLHWIAWSTEKHGLPYENRPFFAKGLV